MQNGEPVVHNLGGTELRIDVPLPPKVAAPPPPPPPTQVAAKPAPPPPAAPPMKRLSRLEKLRLEQEETRFQGFLDQLRMAQDKAEFEQFINERRKRASTLPG